MESVFTCKIMCLLALEAKSKVIQIYLGPNGGL